jgi:hypothetical protein
MPAAKLLLYGLQHAASPPRGRQAPPDRSRSKPAIRRSPGPRIWWSLRRGHPCPLRHHTIGLVLCLWLISLIGYAIAQKHTAKLFERDSVDSFPIAMYPIISIDQSSRRAHPGRAYHLLFDDLSWVRGVLLCGNPQRKSAHKRSLDRSHSTRRQVRADGRPGDRRVGRVAPVKGITGEPVRHFPQLPANSQRIRADSPGGARSGHWPS